MGLRDILKRKDHAEASHGAAEEDTIRKLNSGTEFKFIRSDTVSQEVIQPPEYPDTNHLTAKEPSRAKRSLDVFRSGRSRSSSRSAPQDAEASNLKEKEGHRRLSQRLHLSKAPDSSEHVPEHLPDIVAPHDPTDKDGAEVAWEQRATMLASQNEKARSRPSSPAAPGVPGGGAWEQRQRMQQGLGDGQGHKRSPSVASAVSSKEIDEDIQEAIRLHEEGNLEESTRLFGKLADPSGANNPLSQVLFGLALRHGWGCVPDAEKAVHYLSAAASNAASVEQLALQAGLKKGGAAKGELVLAIFELANCFRHGWGILQDPLAAKQYYETAANLGDTDAMNETAWCYLEGYGCKKDKFAAARYYRLAEKAGNKTLGNSWIWKEKYDPPGEGSGSGKKK